MTLQPPLRVSMAADDKQLGEFLWLVPKGIWAPPRGGYYLFHHGMVHAMYPLYVRIAGVRLWSEVRDLRVSWRMRLEHDEMLGSVAHQPIHTLNVTFNDGKQYELGLNEPQDRTLASVFFTYGMRTDRRTNGAPEVAEEIRAVVARAQLPGLEDRLLAGQTVAFGPITATPDGLLFNDAPAAWDEISGIRYETVFNKHDFSDQGSFVRLYLHTPRDGQHVFTWPSHEVPNFDALELLLD